MVNFTNFWKNTTTFNILFIPLSYLYLFFFYTYKFFFKEKKLAIPVVCVGNLVVGGAGKTPVAIKLRQILSKKFKKNFVLLRGYNGKNKGPQLVKKTDRFEDVGDESLIHCIFGKTCIAKNKLIGADFCLKKKADLIIMDDGLQSNDIKKNVRIVVIDSSYEFGNKKLLPAGPLRQTIKSSFHENDFAILLGNYKKKFVSELKYKKVFFGKKTIRINCKNKKLFAFSGLGNNTNFFKCIRDNNYNLIKTKEFKDHHIYKDNEIQSLLDEAKKLGLQLVCTEKDYVKINKKLQKNIYAVNLKIELENERKIYNEILNIISSCKD